MGALLAGVAVIGDGSTGPVLMLGGIAAFIVGRHAADHGQRMGEEGRTAGLAPGHGVPGG
jgi:hypothetical protein